MRWNKLDLMKTSECVYAIYIKDLLVYIGRTTKLEKRISDHRSTLLVGVPLRDISVKFRQSDNSAKLEARLIRRLRPRFNVAYLRRVG